MKIRERIVRAKQFKLQFHQIIWRVIPITINCNLILNFKHMHIYDIINIFRNYFVGEYNNYLINSSII